MARKTARREHSRGGKQDDAITREYEHSKALRILGLIGIFLLLAWVVVAMLEPTPAYKLSSPGLSHTDSAELLLELEGLTGASVASNTVVEPFYNGENYYEAELAAMRAAQHTIDLEAYIFKPGEISKRAVAAMAERARAGVRVNVVLDAIGSSTATKRYFHDVIAAGGRVHWYHPLRWNNWFRFNNRTHRELLVIDGRTGFVGGAGYADYWYKPTPKEARWRDNMFRVEGDAVTGLQSTFVENWVESSDEVIVGSAYFPEPTHLQGYPALVITSSPSMGGSTRARLLFTALIAAAHRSIDIATPYFLPDKGMRDELVKAMRERAVQVRIVVPGEHTDHQVVRASSRSGYGDLLAAGAHIYEYRPAMLHEKLLIVDGSWVVVGSTNLDMRSFGLNDEINVAALNPPLAARVAEQYERDLHDSKLVSLDEWKRRSIWEHALASIGWIWSRQQ